MPTKQEIADELAASKTKAELQELAKADNENKEEAEAKQLDETVEGGRYKVGNEYVDAHGEKVK